MTEVIELPEPDELLQETLGNMTTVTQAPPVVVGKPKLITAVRNPKHCRIVGQIECEVLHADYGWIPFVACPNDLQDYGREIYAQILAGDYGTIAPLPGKTMAEQKAEIASQRYDIETGGIVINGLDINTERSSQGLILGAALEAFMDPTYSLQWKTPTGFVPLNATTVLFIAKAIRSHVQACFDREAELVAAVEAGTYTDSMLHLGWPG